MPKVKPDYAIDLIMVSREEIKFRKGEIELNAQDGRDLITNKDVFKKFLDKCTHAYSSKLGLGFYKGKEFEAYEAIKTIEAIKKEVDNTEEKYNQYVAAKKKEIEAKEKAAAKLGDEQSQ